MEHYLIKGHDIQFDDDTHTYYVDGNKCISATQLLKYQFPNKYKNINQETLNNASEKGTELHRAIELYVKYGFKSEELKEFRNYMFLQDKFEFKVIESEVPILLEIDGIYVCGRLDQLQYLKDGKLAIGDIKRTSTLDKEYLAYQLNIYRLGFNYSRDVEINRLTAIHLHDDKRKFIELPVNEQIIHDLIKKYKDETNN